MIAQFRPQCFYRIRLSDVMARIGRQRVQIRKRLSIVSGFIPEDSHSDEMMAKLNASTIFTACAVNVAVHQRSVVQDWKGMDGAAAWHLIDRHADGWAEVGSMMEAWRLANERAS